MTILNILPKDEIKLFDRLPEFTAEDRKRFFSLPAWAEDEITNFKTPVNKVGFTVQLGYFRATKKFYPKNLFHETDLQFISKRAGIDQIANLKDYANTTLQRQRKIILEKLGYQAYSDTILPTLSSETDFLFSKQVRLKEIFLSLLQFLEQKRIEIPSYNSLAHIITDSFRRYEKGILQKIKSHISLPQKSMLDDFLTIDEAYQTEEKQQFKIKQYKLTQLKKAGQSTRPSKIQTNINNLLALQQTFHSLEPVTQSLQVSPEIVRHYATIVQKGRIAQIARRDERRYLYLLCFIIHRYYIMQDLLIDVLIQTVTSTINKTEQEQRETFFHERGKRIQAVKLLTHVFTDQRSERQKIKELVFATDFPAEEIVVRLRKLLTKDDTEFDDTINLLQKDSSRILHNDDYYDLLLLKSLRLQKRVADIIKHVEFNEETSTKAIIYAINYFKEKGGNVGDHPPIVFLPEREQEVVFGANRRLRVSLYKALLFVHIAIAIKSGSLNLKYSYKYRSFDEYLIPKNIWEMKKHEILEHAELIRFQNFPSVIQELTAVLEYQYELTNQHITGGRNEYIHLHKDKTFTLTTPKEEDGEETSVSDLFPKANVVSLFEVLTTVESATGFLDVFSHWQTTHIGSKPNAKTFFAAIIGLGCNIGIKKFAKISTNINHYELEKTVNWYFSVETLNEANDKILSFTNSLPLPGIFQRERGITHTSSDGQKFPIAVDSLNANYSYKYFGKGKGVSVCSFIDERHLLFYSTVISSSEREAVYVIDGLMHNDVVKSDIHSTDTHGYAETIFATTHLLGFSFAPRIKDFTDQWLYSFTKRKIYQEKGFPILPDETINTDLIEAEWDNILRFIATIKLKETTASQLFQRLTSYSHQHPLYRALKEFGHITKSIFLLKYIDESVLRQAIEKQMNKSESANKFAKAVFYDNNHEFQQETKEEQLIAEGCKRLIENAIILWNYLYLSEKVAETPEQDREELLTRMKNSSVVCWQHINFHGEYDFSDEKLRNIHQFNISLIFSLQILLQTGTRILTNIFSRQRASVTPVVI